MAARLEFAAVLISFQPGRARTRIVLEAETGANLSAKLTGLLQAPSLGVRLEDQQLTLWDHLSGGQPRRAAPSGEVATPPPVADGPAGMQYVSALAARPWTADEEAERITIGGHTRPMGWWLDFLGDLRTALFHWDQWLDMLATDLGPWAVDGVAVRQELIAAGALHEDMTAKVAFRRLADCQVSFAPRSAVLARKGRGAMVSAG